MGMPITKYSALHSFKSYEDTFISKYIKQFNLFAFVIYDYGDKGMVDYMSKNFQRLSSGTGDKFLFFTLTNPECEERFFDGAKEPLRWDDVENVFRRDDANDIDDDLYLYALTQLFKVSYEELPVIIVTRDLKECEWYVIGTGKNNIAGDLVLLSGLSEDKDSLDNERFEEELDNLFTDAGRYWFRSKGCSVVDIVTCTESACALDSSPIPFANECTRSIFDDSRKSLDLNCDVDTKDVLRVLPLVSKHHRFPRRRPDMFGRALPDWFQAGFGYEPRREPRGDVPFLNQLRYLENNTKNFLQTYMKVSPMLRNVNADNSVLAGLLYHIFESELNASVLQQMRQSLGIEMPLYYNKYDPYKGKVCVQTEYVEVNLNMYRGERGGGYKRFVSPGLGNAYYAFDEMLCDYPDFMAVISDYLNDSEDFASQWRTIFEIRNRECHGDLIDVNNYREIDKAVSVVSKSYLQSMIQIKQDLNSPASI